MLIHTCIVWIQFGEGRFSFIALQPKWKSMKNQSTTPRWNNVVIQGQCQKIFQGVSQGYHCYFKTNSLIFPNIFHEMLLFFSWFSLIFLLFLSTDVVSGRALTLFFIVKTFDSIKCRTAFKTTAKKNAINKGKTQLDVWLSIERVTSLKWNNSNSLMFLIFQNTFLFPLIEFKTPWFSPNSLISLIWWQHCIRLSSMEYILIN